MRTAPPPTTRNKSRSRLLPSLPFVNFRTQPGYDSSSPPHASPRSPSRPSRTIHGAIARAAPTSAHHQPSVQFAASPMNSVTERYVQTSVSADSETSARDPSLRALRSFARPSTGIAISDATAGPRPTPDASGVPPAATV